MTSIKSTTLKTSIDSFLQETAQTVASRSGKNLGESPIFSEAIQELDGFRIGFMNPELFGSLCKKHGLNPRNAEAIMMQTTQQTCPHMHVNGESHFLPLGERHGYVGSKGGTYIGKYSAGPKTLSLRYVPAVAGRTFCILAGQVHFFSPETNAEFTAIALVSPRVKRDDGNFDIIRFARPVVSANKKKAFVRTV